MSLFVAEVRSRPIAIFNAADQSDAEDFVDAATFQDGLNGQTVNGEAVGDGVTVIDVRDAQPAEERIWQRIEAEATTTGGADDGDLLCVWLTDGPQHNGAQR